MKAPVDAHGTNAMLLTRLGSRLAHQRLQKNLSQKYVAEQAGVSLRTIARLESGQSVQLDTLLSVLRVLSLLDRLEALVPEPAASPLSLARTDESKRQRATRKGVISGPTKPGGWTWGDES
jgi:transcriptional regulator with XRE-family HTH domain